MKYGVKVILTYSVEPDNRKFYEAITNQCDTDEMCDLRYDEFN